MKHIITALFFVCMVIAGKAQIQNDFIDLTFGSQGIALGNVGNPYGVRYTASALQSDGKIVVAGTADSVYYHHAFVMRFNSDGSVDYTFAGGGSAYPLTGYTRDSIMAVAIQNDGKVVIAGFTNAGALLPYNMLVMRYNTDGTLDNTFGTSGRKVIAAGNLNLEANKVAIQSDQKIVLAGYKQSSTSQMNTFAVVRLTTTGALDNAFGTNGTTVTSFYNYGDDATALTIQLDQKILLAGTCAIAAGPGYSNNLAVARYNTNGTLDNTFGTGGKLNMSISEVHGYDRVCGVALQSDQKIVVAGSATNGGTTNSDYAAVRFSSTGTIDSSFGFNGLALTDFEQHDDICESMAIGPNDEIVLTGSTYYTYYFHVATAVCNSDGNPTILWSTQGKAISNLGPGSDVMYTALIQPDMKIIVAGESFQPGNEMVGLTRYYNSLPNGINEPDNGNLFNVYPNPANGLLNISLQDGSNSFYYTITDAVGRTVLNGEASGNYTMLNIAALTPGAYILHVNNGSRQAVKGFIAGR